MEKLLTWIDSKLMPVAYKLSNQRHMSSIRKGIVATLPLTIVGSFFVILLNIPIDGYAEFIAPYKSIIDVPFRFTVGILALYASYGIGAALSRSYELDEVSGGMLATVAFLISSIVSI